MAGSRTDLHTVLLGIMGTGHVYFQPPASVKLSYPCIIYSRTNIDGRDADDTGYLSKVCYEVILIDKTPDSSYIDKILALPYASYTRFYAQDGLNHDVFRIYY